MANLEQGRFEANRNNGSNPNAVNRLILNKGDVPKSADQIDTGSIYNLAQGKDWNGAAVEIKVGGEVLKRVQEIVEKDAAILKKRAAKKGYMNA